MFTYKFKIIILKFEVKYVDEYWNKSLVSSINIKFVYEQ